MVDSDRGITNLRTNDIIWYIFACNAAFFRSNVGSEGKKQKDTKAMIPDRSYHPGSAGFCKRRRSIHTNGNWQYQTLADDETQKAEEYGSHDKTFIHKAAGRVQVVDAEPVAAWADVGRASLRMCQVKVPVKTGFQRNSRTCRCSCSILVRCAARAHDIKLIKKVEAYLPGVRYRWSWN